MSRPIEKMADVFDTGCESDADALFDSNGKQIADFSGLKKQCRHSAHAINCHDDLVEALEEVVLFLQEEGYSLSEAPIISLINKAKGIEQ